MKYNLQMVEALDAFKKPKQYWVNRIPPGTACSVYPPTAANMNRKRTDRHSDAMFSQVSFNFDRQLSGKVIVLCKCEDILLFSLLSAVFKTCLHFSPLSRKS